MSKEIAKIQVNDQTRSHTITTEIIFLEQTQFKVFPIEIQCIDYIKTKPNLHLFAEDINSEMKKRFFAIDYTAIFLLSAQKKFHLYEYFNDSERLKLFLDIDIKSENIPDNANKKNLLEKYIKDSIVLMLNKLKKYNIIDPQIIILKSSSKVKLSSHVIFNNVIFENIKAMKFFVTDGESNLLDKDIIDASVYKKGGLRMLYNSKCGKDINLEYHRSENYTYVDDETLFKDCLLRNIGEDCHLVNVVMPVNVKIMNKVRPKRDDTIVGIDMANYYVNHPVSSLQKYTDILDITRKESYGSWLFIGMILHNCNPSAECFELWDTWSQGSETYSSKDYNAYKWNSFRFGYFSIGSLKHYAKCDSPEKYPDVGNTLGVPIFDSIKFTSNYLLNTQVETIKDNKSFVSSHMINWMTNNVKTMAILACYNSGKSDIVHKLIEEFNPPRILFISYRQTLTNEFAGTYQDLDIQSYLDDQYDANRLICQIESLYKLMPKCQFIGQTAFVPTYDIVVIDEIESVLNHFMSSTIENKTETFSLMKDIVFSASKVLALDGDFHNRSYTYLKSFGDVTVLQNEVKKDKRHFIFTNDRNDFETKVDADLKSGKNVVVVSMSSKIATHFYSIYHETYPSLLHCAKSDDKDKEKLKNVNKNWLTTKFLAYSPSVEAGVNFSLDHFDKIYFILSPKSTSPRGLLQMGSRVRKVTDANILVYLNNMPFKEKSNFYTYDEMKAYVCEVYSNYLKPIRTLNNDLNKIVISYNFDLFAEILVYNETERANKTSNLFVAYLIKLLTEKGHTYEHSQIRASKKAFKKDLLLKNEVLNAPDIEQSEYRILFGKQCKNQATREDKIKIERYEIKQDWNVTVITDEFLTKFYGKTYVLFNLKMLLNSEVLDPYAMIGDDKCSIIFDKAEKIEQIKMLKEVITKLGFIKPGDGIKVMKDQFEKNVKDVIKMSQLFVNTNKSQPLFEYSKGKICEVETIKQFMGFLNSLLSEWGIVIKFKNVGSSKTINGIKTNIKIGRYVLNYINNINRYV